MKEVYVQPRITVTQLTRLSDEARTRSHGARSLPDMIKDLINDVFG